jgi:AraC-like DNA-binding protein
MPVRKSEKVMIARTKDLIALMSLKDLQTLIARSNCSMARFRELLAQSTALSQSFSNDDEYVDPGVVWQMLSLIGYEVDDEVLGLCSHRVPPGSAELMVARALQEPTLGEAINAFANSANILWPDIHVETKTRLDELHFCMSSKREYLDARQIYLEVACIPFYCTFQWLSDTEFPARRFRTAANRPSGALHLLAILDCGVQFEGEGVDIVLPRSVASLPTTKKPLADWRSDIYQIYLNILQNRKNSVSTPRLQSYVTKALRSGIKSQRLIAASAGLSVATLRRNLAMERTSFRELSDRVFGETVNTLIASREPVEAIAAQMKYADARSFRRAFRRVFGVNPSKFRKSGRSREAAARS